MHAPTNGHDTDGVHCCGGSATRFGVWLRHDGLSADRIHVSGSASAINRGTGPFGPHVIRACPGPCRSSASYLDMRQGRRGGDLYL